MISVPLLRALNQLVRRAELASRRPQWWLNAVRNAASGVSRRPTSGGKRGRAPDICAAGVAYYCSGTRELRRRHLVDCDTWAGITRDYVSVLKHCVGVSAHQNTVGTPQGRQELHR